MTARRPDGYISGRGSLSQRGRFARDGLRVRGSLAATAALLILAACEPAPSDDVAALEARVAALEALEERVAALEAATPTPLADLDALTEQMDELSGELSAVSDALGALEARVAKLSGAPVQDWLHSHGGTRSIQFQPETGELLFVGEAAHGFDWFSGAGGFWWCSLGPAGTAPVLSFLLREGSLVAGPEGLPTGISEPYNDLGHYSMLRMDLLVGARAFVNTSSGNTDPEADYREIDSAGLEVYLYQAVDGALNIAVMGTEVDAETAANEALGDGSENRDNGFRLDLALRANVELPSEKLAVLGSLSEASTAYPVTHPTGF